jgi:hypothetical protein
MIDSRRGSKLAKDKRVTGSRQEQRTCYEAADELYCGHRYAALEPRSQVSGVVRRWNRVLRSAAPTCKAESANPCLVCIYAVAELHALAIQH